MNYVHELEHQCAVYDYTTRHGTMNRHLHVYGQTVTITKPKKPEVQYKRTVHTDAVQHNASVENDRGRETRIESQSFTGCRG